MKARDAKQGCGVQSCTLCHTTLQPPKQMLQQGWHFRVSELRCLQRPRTSKLSEELAAGPFFRVSPLPPQKHGRRAQMARSPPPPSIPQLRWLPRSAYVWLRTHREERVFRLSLKDSVRQTDKWSPKRYGILRWEEFSRISPTHLSHPLPQQHTGKGEESLHVPESQVLFRGSRADSATASASDSRKPGRCMQWAPLCVSLPNQRHVSDYQGSTCRCFPTILPSQNQWPSTVCKLAAERMGKEIFLLFS